LKKEDKSSTKPKSLKNIIEKWEITTIPQIIKTELVVMYIYPSIVCFTFGIEDKNEDKRNANDIIISKDDGMVLLATDNLRLLEKQYINY
jgi:hypothetical protein